MRKTRKHVNLRRKTRRGGNPSLPISARKVKAWLDFVFMHANTYGWPSFPTKDGQMPKSIPYLNGHIFEGSVYKQNPHGTKINLKYAMSLAKYYWNPKDRTGVNPELYATWKLPCRSYTEPPTLVNNINNNVL